MNKLQIKENINIKDMIYEIRGKQVMLDSDLAILYHCKNGTKSINLSVNRNIERFPNDFYFQLTNEEYINLKFQNETSKVNTHGGIRKLPYVFTEQGVAMLSSVLHTEVASHISISIMRAFAYMRKYMSNSLIEQKYINELVLKDSKRIDLLEETFSRFKESNNEIYFEGQIYDAYSKIIDIISQSKKELIIIDSYADKNTLDIISNIKCKVILICKSKTLLKQIDIDKYNKQYHNLKIVYNDTFHDRYFILDRNILYHCGTSLNHIGEKTFSINKIEDKLLITRLIEEIKKII